MRARGACAAAQLAVVASLAAAGCGGGDDGESASGADVFAEAGCGDCHTLAAARSTGTTGSKLDETRLDATRIAELVRNGAEGMPPYSGRLSEDEIAAVAAFVARSASRD